MNVGNHKCKVVGCFTGEAANEKKTPFFGIEFQKNETDDTIYWMAYLSTKEFQNRDGKTTTMAKENLATLVKLGYKGRGVADMSDESKTVQDLFVEITDNINVVVEEEEYTNDDGELKTVNKVKYVNIGYGSINKFDHGQAVAKFKSCTFDGLLMSLRKASPSKKAEKSEHDEPLPSEDHSFAADDIPF